MYSQVFRPGKAKIPLQGASFHFDSKDDRIFVVKVPEHYDERKGKNVDATDHIFRVKNKVSRDQWFRALNQAQLQVQRSPNSASTNAQGQRAVQPPGRAGFSTFTVTIPTGVVPGQNFIFVANGRHYSAVCPRSGKKPGDTINVTLPIPQQPAQAQVVQGTPQRTPIPSPQRVGAAAGVPPRVRVQAQPQGTTQSAYPSAGRVRVRARESSSTSSQQQQQQSSLALVSVTAFVDITYVAVLHGRSPLSWRC